MTGGQAPDGGRIDWLDHARLACALAVMFYHYVWRGPVELGLYPLLDSGLLTGLARLGFLGLDLFFIISGYVIMRSAQGRSTSGQSAGAFAAARLVRVWPGYAACMTISAICLTLAASVDARFDPVTLIRWLGNLVFAYAVTDASALAQIDVVYWTLLVELKFYALVTLALLLGQARRLEGLVLGWLALATAGRVLMPGLPLLGGSYLMIITGCLLHFLTSRGVTAPRLAAVVLALGLAIEAEVPRAAEVAGLDTGTALVAVAAIVGGFVAAFLPLSLLRWRLPYAAWLGALTYPLYLLHQEIGLVIITALQPRWGTGPAIVLASVVAIALAALVAGQVERRFQPVWRAAARHLVRPMDRLSKAIGHRQSVD